MALISEQPQNRVNSPFDRVNCRCNQPTTGGTHWIIFLNGAFIIGQGVSHSGEELVAMRALQGVSLACYLASSVSIVTQPLPPAKGRNLAFSCLGLSQPLSQPLGLSLGLVIGGVIIETTG